MTNPFESTLSEALARGIEIRRQCGIPITENIICPQEAVGDITVYTDDDMEIPMPVCQGHLAHISENYNLTA